MVSKCFGGVVVHHRNILMDTPNWEAIRRRQRKKKRTTFLKLLIFQRAVRIFFNAINCYLLIFKEDILHSSDSVLCMCAELVENKMQRCAPTSLSESFSPKKKCIHALQSEVKREKMAPISNLIAILDNIVTWLKEA